jgi:RNA polymerase-interacting CarD/CdnL/TRCF family regulator
MLEFRSGDDVIHAGFGLGNIVRLEERQLAEAEKRRYYVLAFDKTTVWVPIDALDVGKLRAVTCRQELDEYRALLKSRPAPLERDHNKRRVEINQRLAQGSFRVICEVVRDLSAMGWYRRIGETDAGLLQKVRGNLRREWAAASGLSLPEAILEVDTLLLAGRDSYKS